jgi:membrane-associated phospholipid phosphatase
LRFAVDANSAWLDHGVVDAEAKTKSYRIATIVRPEERIFKAQALRVANYAELREERASEILTQLTPQWVFWNSAANLRLDRRPKTQELLGVALSLASFVEMRFKHALACPRPSDYLPSIQPIIPVPLHGSLPSGHATEAFTVVHLLEQLLPHGKRIRDSLQRLAERTSINRTVAGVHFPIDSQAGRMLGQSLGEYLVCLCGRDDAAPAAGRWHARTFEAEDEIFDFPPNEALPSGVEQVDPQAAEKGAPQTALRWLWEQACEEWK